MTFEDKLRSRRACSTTWASTSSRPASRSPRSATSRPSPPSPRPPSNGDYRWTGARDRGRTSPAAARRYATPASPRIHTFVSTSPIHLAHQMNKTEAQVLEIIARTVTQARNLVARRRHGRRWTPPAPRSTTCAAASRPPSRPAPATINLPDTVGYATPAEYEAMFRTVSSPACPNADKAIFSTQLPRRPRASPWPIRFAGVAGGARQIECTTQRPRRTRRQRRAGGDRDGGEDPPRRAALCHRPSTPPCSRGPRSWSRRVSLVPRAVQQGDRRPETPFAHESGIHQDGVLKNALTYEIMTPDVRRPGEEPRW